MKRKTDICRLLCLVATIAVGLGLYASPAFAIEVIGKIRVKIDGFKGWHQLRDTDLEIHLSGVPGNTRKDGAFHILDLGIFGRGLIDGSRVTFTDSDRNYVRFLVGKSRIVLPVEWEGKVNGDVLVLKPMYCEVLANGTGGCTRADYDPGDYENELRRQVGLPIVEQQAPSPSVVGPDVAPTSGPDFIERPAGGLNVPQQLPDQPKGVQVQQPYRQPSKPAQPTTKPKRQSEPKMTPDKEMELEIVEPIN